MPIYDIIGNLHRVKNISCWNFGSMLCMYIKKGMITSAFLVSNCNKLIPKWIQLWVFFSLSHADEEDDDHTLQRNSRKSMRCAQKTEESLKFCSETVPKTDFSLTHSTPGNCQVHQTIVDMKTIILSSGRIHIHYWAAVSQYTIIRMFIFHIDGLEHMKLSSTQFLYMAARFLRSNTEII